MKRIAALAVVLFFTFIASGQTADLVVTNANIRTMDAKRTIARSMAVTAGRIIAIGSDADTKKLMGPGTRVVDAKGRLVLPGFNDAHVHFIPTGHQLSQINLRDAKTPEEFVRRIKEFAAKLPKGRWITGGRWDHENWTPANIPTAAMIDAATPDNPVFINRLDGHMALANSLAMRLAHRPGALLASLEPFAKHGVNLLKIESRPIHGRPWEYQFFIDVEAEDAANLDHALAEVRKATSDLRVLGRYKAASR